MQHEFKLPNPAAIVPSVTRFPPIRDERIERFGLGAFEVRCDRGEKIVLLPLYAACVGGRPPHATVREVYFHFRRVLLNGKNVSGKYIIARSPAELARVVPNIIHRRPGAPS